MYTIYQYIWIHTNHFIFINNSFAYLVILHALTSADFYQNQFFSKKLFQEYLQSVKQIGYRHFVGPDLDPNCLQRLSADNISRERDNAFVGM